MHRGGAQLRFAWRRTSYRPSVLECWPHRGFGPRQLQSHGWIGFEKLRHVELRLAQRFEVRGHGLIGRAIEARRVDTLLAQVVLKAHPRRGYFGNPRKSQRRQVPKLKLGTMVSAHQIERVAGDDLAKADERRAWLKVMGLHDPHRPTPGNIDRASEESRYAVTRNG